MSIFRKKSCGVVGGSNFPVLPLDKPHSCNGCRNVLEEYSLYPLAACKYDPSLFVRTSEKTHLSLQYRTWEACDKYEPNRTCGFCKHYVRKTITYTLADTERQDTEDICQKGHECMWRRQCKYWEAKE